MVQRQPRTPPLLLPSLAPDPTTLEPDTQAPSVNHGSQMGLKIRRKREVIYSFEPCSYAQGAERRSSPPSRKTPRNSKGRSPEIVTDAVVDTERRRLIALLASAPDETVQGIFPLVE